MTARLPPGRGFINGQLESFICFNLILFSKILFASSVSCSRCICQDESLSSGLGPSECYPPARLATKLNNEKPRDDVYGPYDFSYLQTSMPRTHIASSAVTGRSVLGVKFKDGVVVATDNSQRGPSVRHGCSRKARRASLARSSRQISPPEFIDISHNVCECATCTTEIS
jgi:hypothetical protein